MFLCRKCSGYTRAKAVCRLLCPCNGEWDELASVMIRYCSTSKHPVFNCSNMLQTSFLTLKKREAWHALQKDEPQNNFMIVNTVLACNQLLFAVKKCIQRKMPVQLLISDDNLNQEEVTALAHHNPKVRAVGHRVRAEFKQRTGGKTA